MSKKQQPPNTSTDALDAMLLAKSWDQAETFLDVATKAQIAYKDTEFGCTLLYTACEGDAPLSLIHKLITKGINPNTLSKSGASPLSVALEHNRSPEMIEIMLDNGANPNAANEDGCTPVHFACTNPEIDPRTIMLLLQYKGDSNFKSKEGQTPLFQAVFHMLPPIIIAMLMEHGGDANVKNNAGFSPFQIAVDLGAPDDLVAIMLDWGADPTLADGDNLTPLELATGRQHQHLIPLLTNPPVATRQVRIQTNQIPPTHICAVCRIISQDKPLPSCLGCHSTYYCSQECQKVHWPEHKVECKRAATVKANKKEAVATVVQQ